MYENARLIASSEPLRSQAAAAPISGMPRMPPSAISRISSEEIRASGTRIRSARICPTNGIEITTPASALHP